MRLVKLFTSFEGRIGRQSYWVGSLTLLAIGSFAALLDYSLGTTDGDYGIISVVTSVGILYSSLALTTKRWHDRDKSGWWTLILLVPVIGSLWMSLELGFIRGIRADNRFGPNPLPF